MPHTLLAVLLFGWMQSPADTADQHPVVVKQLNDRINHYLTARKNATKGVPAVKPQSSPEQIQAHKTALAQAIRKSRPTAAQGDIFTPEVKKYFLKVIQSEMRGKDGVAAKKAVEQGNPTKEGPSTVVMKVNESYPESAPLSTVPATLLQRLPQLPKQLDIRFVGRYMILRDTEANVIVDFIPNAIP